MADQQANDPLIGTRFHDYRVEKEIARGGMGAVYLCRHVELPNVCKVLKVIATELIQEPDPSAGPEKRANAERASAFLFERFEREAAALAQLDHRYITPIDGIGTIEGRRCILMPFLDGKALDQVLREHGGQLSPHEALHIAAQIARALDYAHRRGIVHRDLKPANVFVTPTEDDPLAIKVIDFGIAKHMHAQVSTAWREPLGTVLFMATEQFEHASQVTPSADVYSLAVMLYVMTTGRYPWGEYHSPFELYRRQRHVSPDPAPTMPPGWEETILQALRPEPGRRPQSMRDLVYPLAVALPVSVSHKSGLGILGAVARRWVEISPIDITLRNSAPSAALHSVSAVWPMPSCPALTPGSSSPAPPGAWPAGSWSAATPTADMSGAWPADTSGAWPAVTPEWPNHVMSGAWPTFTTGRPATPFGAPNAAGGTWLSAAGKLVLLATLTAVLVGIVVVAMVALVRTPAPGIAPALRTPPTTTAPAGP